MSQTPNHTLRSPKKCTSSIGVRLSGRRHTYILTSCVLRLTNAAAFYCGALVRFWHKADIPCLASMSAFGGKAGIGAARIAWPVENAPSPNQMLAETYLIALPLRAFAVTSQKFS